TPSARGSTRATVRTEWPRSLSPPEALREERREPRLADLRRGGVDVVFEADVLQLVLLLVPDQVRRARVAVAGLPHAADVHDVAQPGLEFHLRLPRVERLRAVRDEGAGVVRVPDE